MTEEINTRAFALAASILAAALMLLLGILGNLGIYMEGVQAMMDWHMFFTLTPLGIMGGMLEAFTYTFVGCYAFIWLYNRLIK